MHMSKLELRSGAAFQRRDAGSEEPSIREVNEAVAAMAKAFSEFRSANDERLAQIEKRGAADPVTEDKVKKLNGELERLSKAVEEAETRAARPAGVGNGHERREVTEHRTQWTKWVRTGEGNERGLNALATRANTVASDPDGGVLVPETVDANILQLLRNESAVRGLFSQISVSSDYYKKLVANGGAGSGWVSETAARPATSGPTWTEVSAFMGEIYAFPQVSQRLLDDARVDMEQVIAEEVAYAFAQKEGTAFLFGTGVDQPKGLFTYPTAATKDGTRVYGTFQHFVSGNASALPTGTALSDLLITMIYSLAPGYRANAKFLMNSTLLTTLRTLKGADGNYLWQPPITAGQPGTLLGYAVQDVAEMPDVAANAFVVAFGDFKRAYQVVDRFGIRTLRDPYTNKPYVGFYTTKRVGGMALDTQAVKILKVSV